MMIDPERIVEDYLKSKVDEAMNFDDMRITVNKKQLVEMTGVSVSTLEQKFFPRSEVLAIEHDCGKKRLWCYPEVKQAWLDFLEEQYIRKNHQLPPYKLEMKGRVKS